MAGNVGLLSPSDREDAIAVISRRLNIDEVRKFLQTLKGSRSQGRSVEWIVAEAEASGGKGSGRLQSRLLDDQLIPFLIDFAGVDLLCHRDLRKKLALCAEPSERDELHDFRSSTRGRGGPESVARAIAERKWHPGKSWAKHFTRVLGFPPSFAGFAGSPSEPDSIEIQPFRPLPKLEAFQDELLGPIRDVFSSRPGSNRAILTLPTGAGKTRTTVEAIFNWYRQTPEPGTVLWVAQSEELCEQAVQAFREVWIDFGHRDSSVSESLHLSRLWGANRKIPDETNVVVASIQMLHAIVSDESSDRRAELEELAGDLCLVVIDEAHRIPAPSYAEVLLFLGINVARGKTSPIPLLGLTATPFRGADAETQLLVNKFNGKLIRPLSLSHDPVADLRKRGVLSYPDHEVLQGSGASINLDTNPQYKEYFETFNDFHPDLLGRLGEESARNKQILDRLCQIPKDWPVLFFGCSVEHATAMAVLLRRKGRTAATVTGNTRASTRRALIEEFRAGRIGTLCNYGVLTTGFDAPKVRGLVISRPTASAVLYEQMIGRGMRGPKFGGTDRCLVIDVVDNIRFGGQMAFTRYEEYWK
jgi:DNA repair protein RadD